MAQKGVTSLILVLESLIIADTLSGVAIFLYLLLRDT
mgnify:CR=1 FL=1